MKRRSLLKLAGAAIAAITTGCCKRPPTVQSDSPSDKEIVDFLRNDAREMGYHGDIIRDAEFGFVIVDRRSRLRATIVAEPIARPPV